MITGGQIRAARALLRWSTEEAGRRTKVNRKTIERLEQTDDFPVARILTIDSIQRTFEAAGIEFVGTPAEGPGVRLWEKSAESSDQSG